MTRVAQIMELSVKSLKTIISARTCIRQIRKSVGNEPFHHGCNEALDILYLRVKHSVLKARLNSENDSVNFFTVSSESALNRYISCMEKCIERYFDLQVEIKFAHPVDFDTDFTKLISTDIHPCSFRFRTISKRYVTTLESLIDYQILDLYQD